MSKSIGYVKKNDIIVYPIPPGCIITKYIYETLDKFYTACGSNRKGVVKFVRGLHKNRYLDYLRDEGKWPAQNNQLWQSIPLGHLIYDAYFGSQKAASNLIKRNQKN